MILKPIIDPVMFEKVIAAGKADGHTLTCPNIVVLDKDEVIGAVTVIPVALVWMDRQKAKVRDSIKLKEMLESNAALSGAKMLCMPCSPASPYFDLLPKDGYVNIGGYNLFIKRI